jgi:hypothetical protein
MTHLELSSEGWLMNIIHAADKDKDAERRLHLLKVLSTLGGIPALRTTPDVAACTWPELYTWLRIGEYPASVEEELMAEHDRLRKEHSLDYQLGLLLVTKRKVAQDRCDKVLADLKRSGIATTADIARLTKGELLEKIGNGHSVGVTSSLLQYRQGLREELGLPEPLQEVLPTAIRADVMKRLESAGITTTADVAALSWQELCTKVDCPTLPGKTVELLRAHHVKAQVIHRSPAVWSFV